MNCVEEFRLCSMSCEQIGLDRIPFTMAIEDKKRTPTDPRLTYVLSKLAKLQNEAEKVAHLVAERASLADAFVRSQVGKAITDMRHILDSIENSLLSTSKHPPGKAGVSRTSTVMAKVEKEDSVDNEKSQDESD
jgi:hypothetical protein